MKTALITGGLGFIGSNLTKILLKKKIVNRCILLDSFGGYTNPLGKNFKDLRKYRLNMTDNIIVERGDARNFLLVYKILNSYKPNLIFHTAALPLAKISNLNANEARNGSVDTTTNILECINLYQNENKSKIKRFIYISSSMVYGNFKTSEITESSETNPIEIYGTMKLAGEIITKGLCTFYKIPFNIIRPSAVYGPTDMNNRVTQVFIEKALRKETINIQGKNEKLDFTYVEDLVKGCVLAATRKNAVNETFNITYGKSETLLSFVKHLSKYIINVKYKIKKRDNFSPVRGTLSIRKAKKILNYKPNFNINLGIKKYLRFKKTIT